MYLSSRQVVRIVAAVEIHQEIVGPTRNFVVVVSAVNMLSVFVSEKARLLVQTRINNLQTTHRLCEEKALPLQSFALRLPPDYSRNTRDIDVGPSLSIRKQDCRNTSTSKPTFGGGTLLLEFSAKQQQQKNTLHGI